MQSIQRAEWYALTVPAQFTQQDLQQAMAMCQRQMTLRGRSTNLGESIVEFLGTCPSGVAQQQAIFLRCLEDQHLRRQIDSQASQSIQHIVDAVLKRAGV